MRVLLAEDHALMRDGLLSLLNRMSEVEVIGVAGDAKTTLEQMAKTNPDVLVMDLSMPDMKGLELVRRVVSQNPSANIIALSMHADRQFVDEVLGAGAAHYVLKDRAFRELPAALRTILNASTSCKPGRSNQATARPGDHGP